MRRQLKLEGIKPLDVLLTSGKKNYHLDELMQMIDQYRKGRDVYVVPGNSLVVIKLSWTSL